MAGARVFAGPDTSVTHLAAASRLSDCGAVRPDRSAALGAMAWRRACRSPGTGLAPSSGGGMCGWSKIRCHASRASWRVACGMCAATAFALMQCRPIPCFALSMRLWPRPGWRHGENAAIQIVSIHCPLTDVVFAHHNHPQGADRSARSSWSRRPRCWLRSTSASRSSGCRCASICSG